MINLMLRYNSDNKKLEYSTNEGSSWSPLDISGMTVVSDITKVDGVALDAHDPGAIPSDVRNVDGSSLSAHASGYFPADVVKVDGNSQGTHTAGYIAADTRVWGGSSVTGLTTISGINCVPVHTYGHIGAAENGLISGRRDVNAQVVGDKTGYSLTAGSYSIRASSMQRGTTTAANVNADVTISAVTMTRAREGWCGHTQQTTNATVYASNCGYMQLISTTVIRFTVNTLINNQVAATTLMEVY